ncbi:MAG: adenine phosphoribosyltransferase [Planctomycetes bacterium]|nr:adenine phosphoribosyltransferase [Planctomycetota bacterium]
MDLAGLIRDVPNFPKEGIIFKDITTLLSNGDGFKQAVDELADKFASKGATAVVGMEARGFIFGAAVAYKLGIGFVPVRKPGKLPFKTTEVTYDLEYGTDTLCMHEDALKAGDKVLLIDDLLATGGTVGGTIQLVEKTGAEVAGIGFLIELDFLHGRDKLQKYDVFSILHVDGE